MRTTLLTLLLAIFALLPLSSLAESEVDATDGPAPVLFVNVTSQAYDFFRPWNKKSASSRSAVGTILEGDQILVTAELIANHTYIELENPFTGAKTPATVVARDYSANLALLAPENPEFLESFPSIQFGKPVDVGETVEIWQLESTGVLLRTDALLTSAKVTGYPKGDLAMLIYELTSAIQSRDGSFTIPLVNRNKLAGLVTRYNSNRQNAIAIPIDVIRHFVEDANDGDYEGFAKVGVSFSATRDPQFRAYIGLSPDNGGVYVTDVVHGHAADEAGIKQGDVILAIDGYPIDKDGNYVDPDYGKISLAHLISVRNRPNEEVEMEVFSDGERKTVTVKPTVRTLDQYVSAPYVYDRGPEFVVVGGLIFQELSQQYLEEWGDEWPNRAPGKLVYHHKMQDTLFPERDRKVVFLSRILPTPQTVGFKSLGHLIVEEINNKEINSLKDLAEALKSPIDGLHRIELADDPSLLFLDAKQSEDTNERIKQLYGLSTLQQLD